MIDYNAIANKYGGVSKNISIGVDYDALYKKYRSSKENEDIYQPTFPAGNLPKGFSFAPGKTIGNVPGSFIKGAKELISFVSDPIKSLQGIGNLFKGIVSPRYAGEEFEPGTTPEEAQAGKGIKPVEQSKAIQTVDAFAKYISEGYGSPEKFSKTLMEDPVRVAFDVAQIFQGGGGIVSKVGKVSGLPKLAEAGSAITKLGTTIDPVVISAKAVAKVSTAIVKGAPQLAKTLATFGTSQATGLSPESIREIIRNPDNFSPSAMKTFTREGIASETIAKIEGRLKQLSETGKEYGEIRNNPNAIIKLEPNFFTELIEKRTGLIVDYGGKITADTLSAIRNPSDIAKLQNIYNIYSPLFKSGEMTAAEFLNLRTDLAVMAKFEGGIGRSKPLQDLSGIIRGELNTKYRSQVQGLEKLDVTFGAEASQLKAIKKDYFNANGTLKDGAVSKIANLTGKGKEAVLGRLEKISPGIGEKVVTLKAIEDIGLASGHKVGTYTRGILAGGGILTLNPAVIAAAIISSPHIAVQILRGYGKLLGLKDSVIAKIIFEYEKAIKNIKANPEGGFVKNPFADDAAKASDKASAEMREIMNDLKAGTITEKQAAQQLRKQADIIDKSIFQSKISDFKQGGILKTNNLSKEATSWAKQWIRTPEGEKSFELTPAIEKELSKYKPTKPVKLYRGIDKDAPKNKPYSSWTYNKEAALEHAGENGKVISRMVSPKEIITDFAEMPSKLQQALGVIDEEMEVLVINKSFDKFK